MRFLLLLFCCCLLTARLAGPFAFAAENPAKAPVADAATPKKAGEAAQTLDALFAELRTEPNRTAGRRIAQQIWSRWNDSGSATVNLLMGWAGEAMAQDKNALAEDLLEQVIAVAPDYPEVWNRRATLYFSMGKIGASLGDIERTLQLEPRHFGALSGLGLILQNTAKEQKALEAWNQVLKIYPANPQAQQAVIELEEKLAGQGT